MYIVNIAKDPNPNVGLVYVGFTSKCVAFDVGTRFFKEYIGKLKDV